MAKDAKGPGLRGLSAARRGEEPAAPARSWPQPDPGAAAVAAKRAIDRLQAANEVDHVLPGHRPTRGGAEVCAAPERPFGVDSAAAGLTDEQGTSPIFRFRQRGPTGRPQGPGRQDRLALRQERRESGEPELAALGSSLASALEGAFREIPVNRANFVQSCSPVEPGGALLCMTHGVSIVAQAAGEPSIPDAGAMPPH